MLDKLTVLEYEKPVADAYAEATRLLVENIAKHIASGRALNTAAWEVQKLKELGMLNRENAAIIIKALQNVTKDTRDAMDAASLEAYKSIVNELYFDDASETRPPEEINRQIIEAWLQTATDKFNLTNTTMLQSAQQAYITAVNGVAQLAVDTLSDAQGKTVYGAFNASTAGILSGGMTLDEAKKTVIGRMAAAGIYGFVDRAGRHWSPEAYASMVLRTTAHNVSVQATKAASQEFGVNVFQCSWHPNSRPTHYDYQGKFYSWDNSYGTFEDGLGVTHSYEPAANAGVDTAAGLFGINCGHEPIPMDEGVSVPFDPADIQPKEESDKGYAQAQEQRAKERAIRHAKMMANVYETAGDDKQAAEWRAKTREEQAALRRYLTETGRTRSRGREQIGGTAPTGPTAEAPGKRAAQAQQTAQAAATEKQRKPGAGIPNAATEEYVSGEGMWINQYLRGRGDFGKLSEAEREYLKDLDTATDGIITDKRLYRNVDASAIFGDAVPFENIYQVLKYGPGAFGKGAYAERMAAEAQSAVTKVKGKSITEKGFMSTTADKEIAENWGDFTGAENPIVLQIKTGDKTRGVDLSIYDKNVSEDEAQKERLLARGQSFTVNDISAKDGLIYVDVTMDE